MPLSEIDQRLSAASAIAREAGQLARRHFAEVEGLDVSMKGPQDYLTEADGAVERLIAGRLGVLFPSDALLCEEGGGTGAYRVWVVDPIDGTANFARGIPHFAISIAFVAGSRTMLGIVYDPIADQLYSARRGGGAFRNGIAIRVSKTAEIGRATLEAGYSTKRPAADYVALVNRLLTAGYTVRQVGSAALGLAQVADGRCDGYCELYLRSWDVLAGLLLVEEAGGWANDFLAGADLLAGNATLACTPALRSSLIALSGIA